MKEERYFYQLLENAGLLKEDIVARLSLRSGAARSEKRNVLSECLKAIHILEDKINRAEQKVSGDLILLSLLYKGLQDVYLEVANDISKAYNAYLKAIQWLQLAGSEALVMWHFDLEWQKETEQSQKIHVYWVNYKDIQKMLAHNPAKMKRIVNSLAYVAKWLCNLEAANLNGLKKIQDFDPPIYCLRVERMHYLIEKVANQLYFEIEL